MSLGGSYRHFHGWKCEKRKIKGDKKVTKNINNPPLVHKCLFSDSTQNKSEHFNTSQLAATCQKHPEIA